MKTIYAVRTLDDSIAYVGCTKNLKLREYQHRAYNPEVNYLEKLEDVSDEQAKERELYWINKMIEDGHPLKNRENKHRPARWNQSGDAYQTISIDPMIHKWFRRGCASRGMQLKGACERALMAYLGGLDQDAKAQEIIRRVRENEIDKNSRVRDPGKP
jgi:hypothetical protein